MAVNPMQRKARQSFLLGMLLMLVIAGIVVAILFMQITNMKNAEAAIQKKQVCVLKTDIKSGNEITSADIIWESVIDEKTQKPKQVLPSVDKKFVATDAVTSTDLIDKVAKIDLKAGTILTADMLVYQEEIVEASMRVQEYNMLTLPTDIARNDYVDIRLIMPNGQDYIVVSKKRVLQSSENTIFVKMTEEEIVMMSNAIVESYITEGSMLYATKYINAGIQVASTPTYLASKDVLDLIATNKNITEKALNALYTRYNNSPGVRDHINNVVSANMEDHQEKVAEGFDEQIKKAQEERNRYIETLGDVDY